MRMNIADKGVQFRARTSQKHSVKEQEDLWQSYAAASVVMPLRTLITYSFNALALMPSTTSWVTQQGLPHSGPPKTYSVGRIQYFKC